MAVTDFLASQWGYIEAATSLTYPSSVFSVAYNNPGTAWSLVYNIKSGSYYYHYNYFVAFDTSALGASATVASAVLYVYLTANAVNTDAHITLAGQYYDFGASIESGDFHSPQDNNGDACAAASINGLLVGWRSVTLLNPSSVSKTGTTRLRWDLKSSGANPTGSNYLAIDNTPEASRPYLKVTYTTGYANSVNGVAPASISAVNGVLTANISKVFGA